MQATLDIEYGRTSVDEGDKVGCGRIAELLDDGSLRIEFAYDNGDELLLKARRSGFSTAVFQQLARTR